MTWHSFEMDLRDGTPVLLRPVEPGDKHLLEIGFEHLSKKSRYFRFFRPVKQLSNNEVEKFVEIDQHNHIAFGALDLTHAEPYPIGLARCIRLVDEPTVAEVAVAVIDSHQGRGLGTILLAAVARAAATRQIAAFVATVLSDNDTMLDLFGELDATRSMADQGVVAVRFPIHGDADRYPDTPTGSSFKRVYKLQN